MAYGSGEQTVDLAGPDRVQTLEELAGLLRALRRRHARGRRDGELTYRELAARTGWSQTAIAEYFTGKTLPPTDRFDTVIELLGACGPERGALATARDRVEERRRRGRREAGSAAAPAAPATGVDGPQRVVPRQLPTAVRQFVGRTAELAALTGVLDRAPAVGTVVVSAICGTAGIGKTALAVYWAHRVAERFPDGQLYVNLRGFDPGGPPTTAAEAIRGVLDALDVPPQRLPASLDAQAALYRSLLADRRALLLLDNAHDTAQVRPLLPATPTCLVVVTSRSQLTGLIAADGAYPVNLDLFATDEARDLLAGHLGPDRVTAEPDAVDAIIARCARLPLALAIVAAHAVTRPRFPLATLAAELRDVPDRLDALSGNDPTTDVRAVFSWSHRALRPAAARLFRLLGLHPGPDISAPATASLAGVSVPVARRLLTELTRAHLIVERVPGRYTFHDLLRVYAAEQVRAAEPADERHAATRRILDHYLHTAYAAARLLNPKRTLTGLVPADPGVVPEELAGYGQALAWFAAEHPVLLGAVEHAGATGMDTHTWQLAWTLVNYLERRGHWHEYDAMQRTALAAAHRLDEPFAQAVTYRNLAVACTRLARYGDAYRCLQRAGELYRRIGDRVGEADADYYLCVVEERQGHHAAALGHAEHALEVHRTSGDLVGKADALNAVGWLRAQLGDHRQGLVYCRQALALHQELGHRAGEADAWDSLGYIHAHLGDYREGVTSYRRALGIFRELGDFYFEADTLSKLGDAHHAAGRRTDARGAWEQALAILVDLGHPGAERVRAKLETPAHPAIVDVR